MINCIDSYQLINPNKKYYENLQDCSRQFKLFSSALFSGGEKKRQKSAFGFPNWGKKKFSLKEGIKTGYSQI